MRITIKQLKKLIRETVEDIDPMELEHQASNLPSEKEDLFQLYSDMYKEMYNIRPRWLRLDDTSEDELRAMINDLDQHYEEEIKAREQQYSYQTTKVKSPRESKLTGRDKPQIRSINIQLLSMENEPVVFCCNHSS